MVPIREIYHIDSFRPNNGGLPSRDSGPNHHNHHHHNHNSNSNMSLTNSISNTSPPLTTTNIAPLTTNTPPPIRPIVVSDFDIAFLNLLKHGQIDEKN